MSQIVVQVVQHLAPGGIESMVLELLRGADADQEVHVVSLEGNAEQACRGWPRLTPWRGRLHFLRKPAGVSPSLVIRLTWLLRHLQARAVHTHHLGPLLYGGLAARLAGVPVLLHTEHDAWHLQDSRHLLLQRHAMNLLRPRLIADSRGVADALREAFADCQPLVIRNGVDLQRFRPGDRQAARQLLGLALAADVRLLGCAARLEQVKGHGILLRALAGLPGHVHLALAGKGGLEAQLRQEAGTLGIAHRVHFLGLVEDMPSFYQALDAFCLASHHEGLPLCLLEAQACGVPVVATRVGAVAEAVCPDSGRLVPAGNAAELAAALRQQLDRNPGHAPRQFVADGLGLADMLDAYRRLTVVAR